MGRTPRISHLLPAENGAKMTAKIDLFTPKNIKNAAKTDDFRVFLNQKADKIEILLYGTVGDSYDEADAATVARILSANRKTPVTMRVNSFGGLAFDGLAIYNALAGHEGPTTGIIESVAASAASLAVIGADRVLMQANAVYHIHEGIAGAVGHKADLLEVVDWLEMFNAAAVATYAQRTGKPAGEIEAALRGPRGDGTKYTAAEALEFGFVDEIIGQRGKTKADATPHVTSRTDLAARVRLQRLRSCY
jgi:ATP-dependent protease ClpP protease subunit